MRWARLESCAALEPGQLGQLADELRAELIAAVGQTGGHLGSGLGVVELTVAIHYVFDTPVGPAGLGRRPPGLSAQDPDRAARPDPHLRQGGGLSGFTKRSESEYDPFGAAHRSTSIIGGAGLCGAPTSYRGRRGEAIAVIGDGAMSAGMAYEAMNNAEAGGQPAGRDPQRQRHVDRAAGGRAFGLSGAAGVLAPVPASCASWPRSCRGTCRGRCTRRGAARPTSSRAAWRWAGPCSRSWAFTTSARSTGTISTS